MTPWLPAPRLRPLPRTVAPLHRESQDSYIERLAITNRILPDDLREHVTYPKPLRPGRLTLPQALAQISRQPLDRLLLALPELREPELTAHLPPPCRHRPHAGWTLQPACSPCLAARNVHFARHWVPPGTTTCLRHSRWTGMHGQQFDISALPEITQAQRRHHRLIRQHSWKPVAQAMNDASRICWSWWDSRRFTKNVTRRRTLVKGPAWAGNRQTLTWAACAYPDLIALADLLVSPHWQSLPFTGTTADLNRFIHEVRTRVAPGYQLESIASADPLLLWIEEQRHHRRLRDASPQGTP
jgi:hypothetical protein